MVGVGEALAGVLAIKDPLKPEARGVVAALHQAGMACHLVTGDNWRTARSIAEQLGIINVTAECLPAGKAEKIKVTDCPSTVAVIVVALSVRPWHAVRGGPLRLRLGTFVMLCESWTFVQMMPNAA